MATSTTQGQEPVVRNPSYVPPPTVDPTENVRALVTEVVNRLDHLREAEMKRNEDLRKSQVLSDEALREADRRLADSELARINDLMNLRDRHSQELKIAEASRIDAIRAVDVGAVAIATQRASEQATVLAAQVQASAEALRGQLQTTATTFKQQLDQTTQQLSDRLTKVEQAQYEGKGQAGNVSPAITEMIDRMTLQIQSLKESKDRGEGRAGISAGLLATVVGIVAAAISAVLVGILNGMGG